jgi:hypothetical protein
VASSTPIPVVGGGFPRPLGVVGSPPKASDQFFLIIIIIIIIILPFGVARPPPRLGWLRPPPSAGMEMFSFYLLTKR